LLITISGHLRRILLFQHPYTMLIVIQLYSPGDRDDIIRTNQEGTLEREKRIFRAQVLFKQIFYGLVRKMEIRLKNIIVNLKVHTAFSGFTVIELLVLVATFTVILTMGLPVFSNYAIQAKVTESLMNVASAKTSISITCQADPTLNEVTNLLAGYDFQETEYVFDIKLSGDCDAPRITVATQATGAQPDPVLIITGDFTEVTGSITWLCVSDGQNVHMPKSCRN